MRLFTALFIMFALPWVFSMGDTSEDNERFCVTGMGYCLNFDREIYTEPQRNTDNYGADIRSQKHEIEGRFSARVDAFQESFEQKYLTIMAELEAKDPELEELNSMITEHHYYLSVKTDESRLYYQAWRNDDRLVELALSAPSELEASIWDEAVRDFSVNWK